MSKLILITGGAGFIGSHLCDELLEHGYRVRVLDNLSPQVHGPNAEKPAYLSPDVQFVKGSVGDPEVVKEALCGVSAVFHFAASVGVGQSMYQIKGYTETNNLGTAVLLESLLERGVERLLVASSMSVYGEGLYTDSSGIRVETAHRTLEQLKNGLWEPQSIDGTPLLPVATPESKPPSLASVYALSKYDQEQMCMMVGRAYGIPTVALRFFNVYGSRQALSNPYTGVLAIFASRYLNGKEPLIFEDGYQKRDFVSVLDVVRACRLALETEQASGKIFNIGSGYFYTVRDVASEMARVLGKESITPVISKKYRFGDIRHCYADITLAREVLGYEPSIAFDKGLVELAGWLEGQIADDLLDLANAELLERGLTV
ncbi:MAG: NAD-dependent epimerase/dehydratase family protein [Fibrobacter sp.]|nr:NAD-dependent epimerase/dehydratase family protein [Fibrobacter sp.]